ncbi:MAG TPA: hypothetical protein VFK33_09020, partial [Bacillales bacterium]|nr:hypothetical protein [Bacillales bacterium]
RNKRNPLGLAGKVVRLANFSVPFEGLASNKGFQPQNKPPVHTGGCDFISRKGLVKRSIN